MSEDFVTFDNKFTMLLNPMPELTYEELHRRANVPLRRRKMAQDQVFVIDLKWGGGEDFKSHSLLPGKSIRMPDKIGREIAADFKPIGGSICGTNPGLAAFDDKEDRREAILDALRIAEEHYHTIGSAQIDAVRQARGHRDDEVETRYRGSVYGTYFLAMEKEKAIQEQIQAILGVGAKG